jgi:hypothetical protein
MVATMIAFLDNLRQVAADRAPERGMLGATSGRADSLGELLERERPAARPGVG